MTTYSVTEALVAAARDDGGGLVVFHDLDGTRSLDTQELLEGSLARASRLAAMGIGRGDRVGIVGPNAPDWLTWAYGTWFTGATLVMLPIPVRIRDRDAFRDQTLALTRGLECRVVAAHGSVAGLLPDATTIAWDAIEPSLDVGGPGDLPGPDPDDIAVIIPTSGSTAAPKGAARTFSTIGPAGWGRHVADLDPGRTKTLATLSYLPMGHAGGLGTILGAVNPSLEIHKLAPQRFVRDPSDFFRLASPEKSWYMAGACSSIAAILRAVQARPEGVDLSGVTQFVFSLEMIDPAVVDQLHDMAPSLRLDPKAIGATYGLSEGGTVSTTATGTGLRVDEIDHDGVLTDAVARAPGPGATAKRVVSCGQPVAGTELRIVDGDGAPVPERHVGEVQVRTSRAMDGYVGPVPEDAFTADGWLRTGDLAYLAEGDLFPVGRSKELIVRQGRKYHPEDIEWAAASGAGLPPEACVAFAPIDASEGSVVVAVEADPSEGDGEGLERRVRVAVTGALGLPLRAVVVVRPGSLPKTPTGKQRRLAARDAYASGQLGS